MFPKTNRQIILSNRPIEIPLESDFRLAASSVPSISDGELLVKTLWLSLDPYMRGRLRDAPSYAPAVEVGAVMVGGVVGKVIESRTPLFSVGDIVEGPLGWQEFAISNGSNLRKVDRSLAPLSFSLGVLGMPGLTAYFGLLTIGQPAPGDTVVVSAASGAVGQVVGQIARIMGCKVVGIAGSREKIAYIVDDLGFDYGINYKSEDLKTVLSNLCPEGIDVYFDNVGGFITDTVMEQINTGARIPICGQISQYNLAEPELAPRNLRILITHQAKMEGFLVGQFSAQFEYARQRLNKWIKSGQLRYLEDIVDGIENAPSAFIGMMSGRNVGKLLVKVAEE